MDEIEMTKEIARRVKEKGGFVYFVGGYVRDQLLNIENKDIDIEIHGITAHELEDILDSLGKKETFGSSFGIYALHHYDIDIALPRCNHNEADPFIGVKQASKRRDFTMNALYQDVLTGEILDYYGGIKDLENHIIRHVDDTTFVEDPLRVIRAAQFASRFHFAIAKETAELSRTIDITKISRERVAGELHKVFLKSDEPSIFFKELDHMGQLDYWFKELKDLQGVLQPLTYHQEGDAYVHTLMVIDAASKLKEKSMYPERFMYSALCHDFGKAVTTVVKDGKITSYEHETKGLPVVRTFLSRITNEAKLKDYVLNMVELHMRPNILAKDHAKKKSTNKMFDLSLCPEDLILLAKADHLGQINDLGDTDNTAFLKERLAYYHEVMARDYVEGKDLIAAGIAPGKDFGEALKYSHKMRLAGVSKEIQLNQTIRYIQNLRNK